MNKRNYTNICCNCADTEKAGDDLELDTDISDEEIESNFSTVDRGMSPDTLEKNIQAEAATLALAGEKEPLSEVQHKEQLVQGQKDNKINDPAQMYLTEIAGIELLTADEEIQLAKAIASGDKSARKHMIESNLRLVAKLARHYVNCGMDLADLIEEGNLGLIIAVEKFDPAKGCRFSTYATWWIRQSIERAIMNHGRTVRVPVYILRELRNYKRKSLELAKQLDRDPSKQNFAALPAISQKKIQKILDADQTTVSLDNPISPEQNNTTFSAQLEDEVNINPLDLVRGESVRQLVLKLIGKLDEQQRIIIIKRFGLDGGVGASLEEVAQEMGSSREKIRQMQNNALRRLRGIMLECGVEHDIAS